MARTLSLDLLNSIKIASPCTADWDAMSGDDRARFCGQCRLNVYNISEMSADDAAALIRAKEGHLCVRLYQRSDGTVITQDCPVGLRLIHRKVGRAFARIAAATSLLIGGTAAVAVGPRDGRATRLGSLRPFATIREWLSPTPPPPPLTGKILMGEVCLPPIAPTPSPKQ